MIENLRMTDRTKEQLEMENETLRKLLHDYVAQVETLKTIYNEQALEWSKDKQNLLQKIEQLQLPN